MPYFLGVSLALATAVLAAWSGMDRYRVFYPLMLIYIALFYVLFAAIGAGPPVLGLEIGIAALFAAVAIAGFRHRPWLVAGALALHGLFDFTHHRFIDNPGVPAWWPGFCMSFDLTAALCFGAILLQRAPAPRPWRMRG